VSRSFFECTISTKNGESINIPVQNCTKVGDLRDAVSAHLGFIDSNSFEFCTKAGSYYKKCLDGDRVSRRLVLRGINSLTPQRHKYPYPYGIIGAGYSGLKLALWLTQAGSPDDWVIFDRYPRVGGHTWLEMANKTTKLQTEFPTYFLWYGPEFCMPGSTKCGGPPVDHEVWPARDKVRDHMQLVVDEFGLTPNLRLGTNVQSTDMIGKIHDRDRYYEMNVEPVTFNIRDHQGGGALDHQLGGKTEMHRYNGIRDTNREPFMCQVSTIAFFPGALVFPRPVHYKGEDQFGGAMDYAVEMRFDYSHVPGQVVTIIGHGAFTMENIRTCLEERCKFIYVLCRKVNLTCPRPVSWFVNQSNPPISAAQMLDMLSVAYKYTNWEKTSIDPWKVHSVMANKDHTHATIWAKTRFGIGDVYFLSQAYGLCEIVTSQVRRCTHHTLHLENGDKIETSVVLKCTGCLGDWKVDEIMKIKEMKGMYVNGDIRRACTGEADGINAASFGATTGGPGMYGMMKSIVHWWDMPNDWYRLIEAGILDQLPTHRAGEPDEEFPAYFFTASHAQSAGIMLGGASPLLGAKGAKDEEYKNFIQHYCLPPEKIIRLAKADWQQYEEKFRKTGMVPADAPYVPYPYDEAWIHQQQEVHAAFVQKRWGPR